MKFVISLGRRRLTSAFINALPESKFGNFRAERMFVFSERSWMVFGSRKDAHDATVQWKASVMNE